MVEGWRSMLRSLSAETPAEYVDWMAIERIEGRDLDIGLHRHWIDPTVPFASPVGKAAHGLVVTYATLRDGSGEIGRAHLCTPVTNAHLDISLLLDNKQSKIDWDFKMRSRAIHIHHM